MDEFLKAYTPSSNIGGLLLLGGLLLIGGYLLFKAIKSLPENPSEEEIEEVISDIPDEAQRENAKILLFDPHMREALRELAKVA